MAGKFTNTNYTQTIDNLVSAANNKLANPYYKFSDKTPTKVTYYSQDTKKSTLDEASGLYTEHIGQNSPFKFNKINNFVLYGIDRISADYDLGDFGIEASKISGNAVVLPNTITPRPGDFFSITYIKEPLLFKVDGVTADTLDTGANVYSIEYSLESTIDANNLQEQVIKEYNFIVDNIGTEFKTFMESSDSDLVSSVGTLIENLITYFTNLFFDSRLQTFVYNHDGWHMYDPFAIEFMIRNKILKYNDEYIYVSHAALVDKTFTMDYLRTFFYSLENKNMELDYAIGNATADLITDPNSLFVTRLENYYQLRYIDKTPYKTRFQVFDMEVFEHIASGELFEAGNKNEFYNLWISYFNGTGTEYIGGDMLELLRKTDYMDNKECFYALLISIYILERCITELMIDTSKNN